MKTRSKSKRPAPKPTTNNATPADGLPQLLTLHQFAERLSFTSKWVTVLCQRGMLPRPDYRIGRQVYWTQKAFLPVLTGEWRPAARAFDSDLIEDVTEIEQGDD